MDSAGVKTVKLATQFFRWLLPIVSFVIFAVLEGYLVYGLYKLFA